MEESKMDLLSSDTQNPCERSLIILDVEGMMCQKNCGSTVQRALFMLPGVEYAEVSFLDKKAKVWGSACVDTLISAIETIGFKATITPDYVLEIIGMMCQKNCGSTVQKALLSVNGVNQVDVSFAEARAKIWGKCSILKLIDAVEIVGFEAKEYPSVVLYIDGMMCQKSCGTTVQNSIQNIPGVKRASVSYSMKQAKVWGTATASEVIDAITAVGFTATPWNAAQQSVSPDSSPPQLKESNSVYDSNSVNISSPQLPVGLFSVTGMSCAACVSKVEKHLLGRQGIAGVRVALLAAKAEVDFDSSIISESDIVNSIISLGYSAEHLSTVCPNSQQNTATFTVFIPSLSLKDHIAKDITEAVQSKEGVLSYQIDLLSKTLNVTIDTENPKSSGIRDIIDAIQRLGYEASILRKSPGNSTLGKKQESESQEWRRLFLISCFLTAPLMFLKVFGSSVGDWMTTDIMCDGKITPVVFLQWIFSSCIQFGIGKNFYRNACNALKNGNMGMDMLVVVGTSASYMYSVVAVIVGCALTRFQPHIFFEAGSMLITFITLGKWLESIAKGKTSEALSLLMQMQPNKAILLINETEEKEIDIDLIQIGDRLKVLPGAKVPTDGVVVQGASFIDESMITGEILAVSRKEGDKVIGGTVNQNGMIIIRAEQIGGDTLISQIIELVEKAQMTKAPIQEYADRIASVFTPTVLTFSLLTFVIWYIIAEAEGSDWIVDNEGDPFLFALMFSISVIVVSCPCALGLATPTAVMVGTGIGASNGILIKGGEALERSHQITTIVFDKTGTLTTGKPVLTDEIPFGVARSWVKHSVLRLAAACEKCSEHPIARTIIGAAFNVGISIPVCSAFESVPGKGVSCAYEGSRILVGNRNWMASNGIKVDQSVEHTMCTLEGDGKTAVIVSLGTEVIGVLAVSDQLKKEAKSTILALQRVNLKVLLVTGDNKRTAHAVAKELGIPSSHVFPEVLPANKAQKVRELQQAGEIVGMIGDGINDSPALATADVGIAVGAGTQVAIEAARIVLVRNNLHDVVVALHLSRCVFKRIRMNFIWAMLYNVCGIPFAAGIMYPFLHMRLPPSFAGLSMTLSSVSVVLSSLSLRLYRRPEITRDGQLLMPNSVNLCFHWLKDTASKGIESVTPRSIKNGSFRFPPATPLSSVFTTKKSYRLLRRGGSLEVGVDGSWDIEMAEMDQRHQGHFL